MNGELKTALKERLDKNYDDFLAQLQEKTVSELIVMAPEIVAAQQCHEELLDACDDDDIQFLLQFDDPLELVRGYWESEITGYDHSGEMGHMLWRIREDYPDILEPQSVVPIRQDEIAIDPVMDFSGREIIVYIEMGEKFDVGKRFQVYPNIDDVYSLYGKYDPVSQTLRAELHIEEYEGDARVEPVELLSDEQEMIVGMMEEICKKDTGKSLREVWTEHHPAINRKNLHGKKHGRNQNER